MNKRHRIFIAINLPDDLKKQISLYEKKWPELPARWTNPANLHLTLSFLDYLTDIQIGGVCVATKTIANQHNSFEIHFNKICYGPIGKNSPRMVWLSGEKSKELSLLKRDLENALSQSIGFHPETRSLIPHITLSRIKMMEFRGMNLEERPEINENVDLPINVESIEIMESTLKRNGPGYTIIESHNLKD